jgi:rod shape-determining protein MreD
MFGQQPSAIPNGFMPQLKYAAVLAVAIILQLSLAAIWGPLVYIDFPLVVVVYIALQREAWQALIAATLAGLIIDAAGGGVVGTGGFSKTLVAYLIYFAATRINLENPLLRIPVLAGATVLNELIYVGVYRVLSLPLGKPVVQTLSYQVIGTTIIGTGILFLLDNVLSQKARQRRQFADRRRVARRSTGILKRR